MRAENSCLSIISRRSGKRATDYGFGHSGFVIRFSLFARSLPGARRPQGAATRCSALASIKHSVDDAHHQAAGNRGEHYVFVHSHPVMAVRRPTQVIRIVVMHDVSAFAVLTRQVLAVTPSMTVV